MREIRREGEGEAERLVADAVGRLIEGWGFRGVLGRIWATLYLSEDPLPAPLLCERLEISRGAASMALTELESWGVVARKRIDGERKDYFEAEIDIWKMVSRVLRERELRSIEGAVSDFEQAAMLFQGREALGSASERRAARLAKERTAKLLELSRVGASLLRALVERGRIDVQPLLSWTRRAKGDP